MTARTEERPTSAATGGALRVRLVVPGLLPGRWSVGAHVLALATRLGELGNDVVVATQHEPGSTSPDLEAGDGGVLVRRFASAGTVAGRPISPGLWQWLREGADGADVVHVHDVHALTSLPALAVAPRPLVLTPHLRALEGIGPDDRTRQVHATAARRAVQRVSTIICATPWEAATFVSRLGAAERVVTLPPDDDGVAVTEGCYRALSSLRT